MPSKAEISAPGGAWRGRTSAISKTGSLGGPSPTKRGAVVPTSLKLHIQNPARKKSHAMLASQKASRFFGLVHHNWCRVLPIHKRDEEPVRL